MMHRASHVYSSCAFYMHYINVICEMYSIDIEETDVESVSEGDTDDQAVLSDASFFDFGFSAAKTDSLPFTVHDAGHAVTRKSHHVICYYLYL